MNNLDTRPTVLAVIAYFVFSNTNSTNINPLLAGTLVYLLALFAQEISKLIEVRRQKKE